MDVGLNRRFFFTAIGTGILVICVGYAVMNNPVLYGIVGKRIDSTFDTIKYGVDKRNDASLEQRSNMKKEALKLWRSAPVLGYGVNSFCELSPVTNHRASSHCGFTEILCSFGIVGFILFFKPFINPLKSLLFGRKNIASIMLLFCLVMEWQSSDFSSSEYILFCFLMFQMHEFKSFDSVA